MKKFINDYYDKAIELKKMFQITENKKWNQFTVLAELNVQFGHLTYLLSDYKEYGELNRNIHDLGDELSDVLLQIFSLCWKCNIDLKNFNYDYSIPKFNTCSEAILVFNTVYGQVSEIIMEIEEYRHYKIRYGYSKQNDYLLTNIAKLIEIVFYIGKEFNIDFSYEFDKMFKDASGFLERYEKSKNINYYPIVDVHATWLVLNPIQGCPKKCRYCFLREKGLNQVKPNILVSPEKAVELLLKSKFYMKDMPLCLESQSDAFSTKENIEYVKQLLELLFEKNIKNPIIFITKCHIPIDFIELIDKYEKEGHKFVFFMSYSGLDSKIEVGVDKKIIEENFINLHKYNKTIVHYWRPFIKENSTPEVIEKVYNYVKQYAVASIAIGLKVTDDIIDNIGWEELNNNREEALKSDNVWDKTAYEYIYNNLKNRDDNYPIYQTTSCALGYALGEADRKFFYTTSICKDCNKCLDIQRKRCKEKYDNYKEVDIKTVIKLLKRFKVEVKEEQIEIKDRIIFINGVTLSFNQISYLTDYLKTQIITQKKEEYYWNTSINNSSILKI